MKEYYLMETNTENFITFIENIIGIKKDQPFDIMR